MANLSDTQNQKTFIKLSAVTELQKQYLAAVNLLDDHKRTPGKDCSAQLNVVVTFERVIRMLDLPIDTDRRRF